MGKAATRKKRTTSKTGDPVVDQLAVVGARNMFVSNLFGMGWRLAIIVLAPIFIGVQLDKKFDTKPSFALTAFFLSIAAASWLIYRTYSEMQREQMLKDTKQSKKKLNRRKNA